MPRPGVSLDHAEPVSAEAWSFPVRYGEDDEWIERRLRRASARAADRAARAEARVEAANDSAPSPARVARSERRTRPAPSPASEPPRAPAPAERPARHLSAVDALEAHPRSIDAGESAASMPERRTITIRGRGAERYTPSRRRPPQPVHHRTGFRPDRAAMWAVFLGLLLVIVAATSSHAAVLHAHALIR